jgi:hypothetical protein
MTADTEVSIWTGNGKSKRSLEKISSREASKLYSSKQTVKRWASYVACVSEIISTFNSLLENLKPRNHT